MGNGLVFFFSAENQKVIYEAGGIDRLVDLLYSETPGMIWRAEWVLCDLAIDCALDSLCRFGACV